jgi:peroxiredoxin
LNLLINNAGMATPLFYMVDGFECLLDPEKKIATEYGAANGIAKYGLDGRMTYVIGGDGKILKVYPKVNPALNAPEIISEFGNVK